MHERVQVSRVIEASPATLFELWTQPEMMMRWWGVSEDLLLVECEMDVRPGGSYRYGMRPKAETGPATEIAVGAFLEVEAPHRLVFSWQWENGKIPETRVTVTFEPTAEGSTKVIVVHEKQPDKRVAAIHAQGWTHMLADLARATEAQNVKQGATA